MWRRWIWTAVWLLGVLQVSSLERAVAEDWPPLTAECKPWTRWWWLGSAVDEAGLKRDPHGYRAEFVELVHKARQLKPIKP